MKPVIASAAAATTLLLAGAAFAQDQSAPSAPSGRQAAPADTMSAPSAMNSGVNASAVNASGATVRVITNGPVPDTAENRARFPPLSQAGRNTKPMGR